MEGQNGQRITCPSRRLLGPPFARLDTPDGATEIEETHGWIRPEHRTDLGDLLDQATFRNDKNWLTASEQDALGFLERNEAAEWSVVYAAFKHVYLHSVLAPKVRLQDYDPARQRSEPFPQPDDRWRIDYSYNLARRDDVSIGIAGPLDGFPTLRDGEKLVYRRDWHGDPATTIRMEVSQKLVHCLEAYWVEERERVLPSR